MENDIIVETVKNKNLLMIQKEIINKSRINEWGEKGKKDFSKDYEPETVWFFVKRRDGIVSLGGLRPIKINFLGKEYHILGICCVVSIQKGFGKILISSMINYSRETGKTILGFTTQTEFFRKAGLRIKKYFIKRFIYVNPKTKEKIKDNSGDGIYFEGKDKFISKVMKTKFKVCINIEHW